MRKQYLQILGLSEDATDTEIKKAYRRKAFLYHPDLNQSPNAKEQFVKIDKAYQSLVNENVEPEVIYTAPPVDEERRRNSAMYRQMANEYKKKQAEQYQKDIVRRTKRFRDNLFVDICMTVFALVIFVYGFLVILDQTLETSEETLMAYGYGVASDGFYFVRLDESGDLTVNASWEVVARIEAHGRGASIIDVELTPIFKLPKKILLVNDQEVGSKEVAFNLFFNWGFPIMMLIPGFWLFYRKPKFPMIVLGNCILFVYPFIIGIHMYMLFTERADLISKAL